MQLVNSSDGDSAAYRAVAGFDPRCWGLVFRNKQDKIDRGDFTELQKIVLTNRPRYGMVRIELAVCDGASRGGGALSCIVNC